MSDWNVTYPVCILPPAAGPNYGRIVPGFRLRVEFWRGSGAGLVQFGGAAEGGPPQGQSNDTGGRAG